MLAAKAQPFNRCHPSAVCADFPFLLSFCQFAFFFRIFFFLLDKVCSAAARLKCWPCRITVTSWQQLVVWCSTVEAAAQHESDSEFRS